MTRTPVRPNRAWIVVGSVLAVIALSFGTAHAISVLAHEEVTETTTLAAAGIDQLDISGDGAIEITGDDVDEITIVAHISHGLRRTRRSAEVEGSTLVVRSSCPFLATWCSVSYRITVPADLLVRARSDNGRLTIRDLDGDATAISDNGRIELVRLGGAVEARADNGRITATGLRSASVEATSDNGRVTLSFAEPPEFVSATSDNGSIEIIVPDTDDSYRVDPHVDNGTSDIGVRTDPASDRTIEAEADNGDISVHYPSG